MSLDRKDVRAKLDPQIHEALSVLCEVDGVDIGEFVEREIVRVVQRRIHAAIEVAKRTERLGITGSRRDSAGAGGNNRDSQGSRR